MWRPAVALAFIVSVVVSGIAAYNRIPWSDEGWFSSPAYNLAYHGFMGTTVLETAGQALTRIEQRTYWVMPLFLLGQALWYKLFPPTIFWTRAFGILWAPVALFAFYRLVASLSRNLRLAALSASLLALSFLFIDNAAFARPDLMSCALGLCGLAAYLWLREKSLSAALACSNAFIAASGLSHPNGVLHLAGLVLLVAWFDLRRLSFKALAAAAAPYAIFGAGWGAYILRDPEAFWDQFRYNGTIGRWTVTLNPLAVVWAEIQERYFRTFGLVTGGWAVFKSIGLFAYAAAVVAAIADPVLRRRAEIRILLALWALYFAVMCVFNQKLSYYLIHILPWYIALLAAGLQRIWQWRRLRLAVAAFTLVLIAVETGGILLKAVRRSYIVNQRQAVDFVKNHSGPRDRIVGSAALLYEFGFDPRLRDDADLGFNSGRRPDVIVVDPLYRGYFEAWETLRPEELKRARAVLSSYRLAFENPEYQVYLKPAAQPALGGGNKYGPHAAVVSR